MLSALLWEFLALVFSLLLQRSKVGDWDQCLTWGLDLFRRGQIRVDHLVQISEAHSLGPDTLWRKDSVICVKHIFYVY